ncbi:unnamed protein product [Musa banksii]
MSCLNLKLSFYQLSSLQEQAVDLCNRSYHVQVQSPSDFSRGLRFISPLQEHTFLSVQWGAEPAATSTSSLQIIIMCFLLYAFFFCPRFWWCGFAKYIGFLLHGSHPKKPHGSCIANSNLASWSFPHNQE